MLTEPLPKKDKVSLRRLCPVTLRIVTSMAHVGIHPVLPVILKVPGDAQVQYALLMHYYRIRGYTPPLKKTRLTEAEKQEIVRLHMQGIPQQKIAERVGRSIGSVHAVIIELAGHAPKRYRKRKHRRSKRGG